jgi:hypothetical protein
MSSSFLLIFCLSVVYLSTDVNPSKPNASSPIVFTNASEGDDMDLENIPYIKVKHNVRTQIVPKMRFEDGEFGLSDRNRLIHIILFFKYFIDITFIY